MQAECPLCKKTMRKILYGDNNEKEYIIPARSSSNLNLPYVKRQAIFFPKNNHSQLYALYTLKNTHFFIIFYISCYHFQMLLQQQEIGLQVLDTASPFHKNPPAPLKWQWWMPHALLQQKHCTFSVYTYVYHAKTATCKKRLERLKFTMLVRKYMQDSHSSLFKINVDS